MLEDVFTERFFRHVNAVVNGTEVIDRIEAAFQRSRHIVTIARWMAPPNSYHFSGVFTVCC